MAFQTQNPSTLEILNAYDALNPDDIKNAIKKAHQTFLKFKHKKPKSRVDKMNKLA